MLLHASGVPERCAYWPRYIGRLAFDKRRRHSHVRHPAKDFHGRTRQSYRPSKAYRFTVMYSLDGWQCHLNMCHRVPDLYCTEGPID